MTQNDARFLSMVAGDMEIRVWRQEEVQVSNVKLMGTF